MPKRAKHKEEVLKTLIIGQKRTVIPKRWETEWEPWLPRLLPREENPGCSTGNNPGRARGTLWTKEMQLRSRKMRAVSVYRTKHQREKSYTESTLWRSTEGCLLTFSRVRISTFEWWNYLGPRKKTTEKIRNNSAQAHAGLGIECSPTDQPGKLIIHRALGSVQSLSRVRHFVTLWTAARQASLSITNSRSLLKLMSIKSVMASNHLILSSPFPAAFDLSLHQGLFKWVSSSHQVAKVLEFQLQHESLQWIFRTDFL